MKDYWRRKSPFARFIRDIVRIFDRPWNEKADERLRVHCRDRSSGPGGRRRSVRRQAAGKKVQEF